MQHDDPTLTAMLDASHNEAIARNARYGTQEAPGATKGDSDVSLHPLPSNYQTIAPTNDAPTVRDAGAVLIAAGIPKDKVSNILASLHSYDADKRKWAVAYCEGRIDVSEWHRAWGLSDFL